MPSLSYVISKNRLKDYMKRLISKYGSEYLDYATDEEITKLKKLIEKMNKETN